MRLYKAHLDDTYKVISYVEPSVSEVLSSERCNQTYEIFLEYISDYVELNGYFTTKEADGKYSMFIDIDYNFSSVWDTETSIYVQDQIVTDIRHKLIDEFFLEENNIPVEEEKKLQGIIGLSTLYVGDEISMYHRYRGGVWDSTSAYIASINRNTGVLEANFPGKTTITYVVDTGDGILSCYKTIEILRKI